MTDELKIIDREPTTKIRRNGDTLYAYCILWGDKRDLQNEYFLPNTNVGDIGDKQFDITIAVDSKFSDFGYATIGEATLSKDEHGIFAVGKYRKVNIKKFNYIDAVNSLVDRGLVHFSTAASFAEYPEGNKHVDEDGHITLWPIYNLHITPTPAEPR